MSHDLILTARVCLLDEALLRQALRDRGLDVLATLPLSVALPAALVRPHRDPSTLSYTVLATGATPQTYSTWLLTVVVRAFDTEYLVAEACRRYRECWDDATWRPATLGEAAYEVLLASNANPAPCDLGFEFVSVEYAHDGPVTVPAAAEALTGTDDETTDAND